LKVKAIFIYVVWCGKRDCDFEEKITIMS